MKLTATHLKQIIREEVKKATSGKKNLSEVMTRITEDEIAAWKNGDLGYVSGDAMLEPGHDHQEFLHGSDEGHPHDDEGYMVKSRMAFMKKMAKDVCGLLDSEDQLPAWVQDHVSVAHENLQQVHGYLTGKQHALENGKDSMGMHESKRTLKESHNRVTREEMSAWMRGDWGFISEGSDDDDEELQYSEFMQMCLNLIEDPETSHENLKEALKKALETMPLETLKKVWATLDKRSHSRLDIKDLFKSKIS